MRLAEALAERKDTIKRIGEYPSKLAELAVWEEDDSKPDGQAVRDLQAALERDLDRMRNLNVSIHRANAEFSVATERGQMSLMEAIALRDELNLARITASRAKDALDTQLGRGGYRYRSRSKEDVKVNTLVAPRDLGREEDALAGEIRRLDLAIQMVNWSQDLPE